MCMHARTRIIGRRYTRRGALHYRPKIFGATRGYIKRGMKNHPSSRAISYREIKRGGDEGNARDEIAWILRPP